MKRKIGVGVLTVITIASVLVWTQLPAIGAGGLLHPGRRAVTHAPPAGCVASAFTGAGGVALRGWTCTPTGPVRGTIVYLHGIADNRTNALGIVGRFLPRGFRVIAYDGRAHGESGGDICTYGFYEKDDLHRVIDTLPNDPVVLIGTSLGAAIALQEAADDPRVKTIVAAETFSDLRTVATERAPFIFTSGAIDRAFALAETEGRFHVDDVSPVRAAAHITVPVLLIHGMADVSTPPAHSERVRAALKTPSELILVPGAGHNHSLNGEEIWKRITQWIERAAPVNSTTPQLPTPK